MLRLRLDLKGGRLLQAVKEFPTREFHYRQIARERDAAIYEQTLEWLFRAERLLTKWFAFDGTRAFDRRTIGSNRANFIQAREAGANTASPSPTKTRRSQSSGSWHDGGRQFSRSLATLLAISPQAIDEAMRRGLLSFVKHRNSPCWRFGDSRNGSFRRIDGAPFRIKGSVKAEAETGGQPWHRLIGLDEVVANDRRQILLTPEGSKDALAAFHLADAEDTLVEIGVVGCARLCDEAHSGRH